VKSTTYTRLERRILADERGGVHHRWQYGRQLLAEKSGRKQLPHGKIADLLADAEKAGLKLSATEIRYRVQCAEAYDSEAKVTKALGDFGSWFGLIQARFPAVELDEIDPDDVVAEGLASAPDEWQQLEFDLPGLKPEISVRGRKVKLIKGEDGGTVADVAEYLDVCEEMHESFGKTIDKIRHTLETMREGADGDDEKNAIDAWEAANQIPDEDDEDLDTDLLP